jgi:hypothetical protein
VHLSEPLLFEFINLSTLPYFIWTAYYLSLLFTARLDTLSMGQRNCLNEKRLTKKQVQELVEREGQLHSEYTAFFKEDYSSTQDLVYELPHDRFLYVFDPQGVYIPGKGDIYPTAYLLQWMRQLKRARVDAANNRFGSVDHWRFYSRHPHDFIQQVTPLAGHLADALHLDQQTLDRSYASLDAVSKACEALGPDMVFTTLYDNVLAYVGEVIRQRVAGHWEVNTTHAGGDYPFVSVGFPRVQYMPINVVWTALQGSGPVDLRKEAANEIRLRGTRVKMERQQANEPDFL